MNQPTLTKDKSKDSLQSGITFLDEEENKNKYGKQNTLDNVSEKQEEILLFNENEQKPEFENKKLRLAENHEQR